MRLLSPLLSNGPALGSDTGVTPGQMGGQGQDRTVDLPLFRCDAYPARVAFCDGTWPLTVVLGRRWLLALPSRLPSGVRGQWAAVVVGHHVSECSYHIRGGSALTAIQFEEGAVEVPH
jgi:hypothetical protein